MDVFIDTNILAYGHDADAGEKHRHAKNLVDEIWTNRRMPAVSIQVLQEMHVNLVRKGIAIDVSAALVSRYLNWRVVENGKDVFRRSLEI